MEENSRPVENKEENKKMIMRDQIWVDPEFDSFCGDELNDSSEQGCVESPNIYDIKFSIPGVKKDKIHLHIIPDQLVLVAPKNDYEEYVSHMHFSCSIDVPGSRAKYENGVLSLELPYNCPNPFADIPPMKID
jgi:HSP20 family molecular chaperone IbpA